ncbi:hypothetical protein CsSME_00011497 [Camellia sinensis var. sinensis]
MSLVDYASSDEDEAEIKEEERENFEAPKDESQVPKHDQPTPLPPQTQKVRVIDLRGVPLYGEEHLII